MSTSYKSEAVPDRQILIIIYNPVTYNYQKLQQDKFPGECNEEKTHIQVQNRKAQVIIKGGEVKVLSEITMSKRYQK